MIQINPRRPFATLPVPCKSRLLLRLTPNRFRAVKKHEQIRSCNLSSRHKHSRTFTRLVLNIVNRHDHGTGTADKPLCNLALRRLPKRQILLERRIRVAKFLDYAQRLAQTLQKPA